MEINILICAFLIIFMLHNLEEIITVEKWLKHTYPIKKEQIPLFFQKEIENKKDMTAAQFAFTVFIVSVGAAIVVIASVMTENYLLFIGLNTVFALNIFTHPIQSLLLRCYTPGVWTSVLLIIPYNVIFYYYCYTEGLLKMNTVFTSLGVMILCIPVLLLSHKIAEKYIS